MPTLNINKEMLSMELKGLCSIFRMAIRPIIGEWFGDLLTKIG